MSPTRRAILSHDTVLPATCNVNPRAHATQVVDRDKVRNMIFESWFLVKKVFNGRMSPISDRWRWQGKGEARGPCLRAARCRVTERLVVIRWSVPGSNHHSHKSAPASEPIPEWSEENLKLACSEYLLVEKKRFLVASAQGRVECLGASIWPLAREQFGHIGYQEKIEKFALKGSDLEMVLHYSRTAGNDTTRQNFASVLIWGEKRDNSYFLPCIEVHNHGTVRPDFSPPPPNQGMSCVHKNLGAWNEYVLKVAELLEIRLKNDRRSLGVSVKDDRNQGGAITVLANGPRSLVSLEAQYQHFHEVKLDFRLVQTTKIGLPGKNDDLITVVDAKNALIEFARQNGVRIRAHADSRLGAISVNVASKQDLEKLAQLLPDNHAFGWPILPSIGLRGTRLAKLDESFE